MRKELFIIEGQNDVIVTMSLPSTKDGGLSNKGMELARHAIGSSLNRIVNVGASLTTPLSKIMLDRTF